MKAKSMASWQQDQLCPPRVVLMPPPPSDPMNDYHRQFMSSELLEIKKRAWRPPPAPKINTPPVQIGDSPPGHPKL